MTRALLLSLVSIGCGTPTLSARGRQVAPLEAEPGPECVAVGPVSGSADPFFGALKPTAQLVDAARVEARNEAARLGATHLRFADSPERWPSGTFGGRDGVTVSGMAYRCERSAPGRTSPGSSAGGCAKDTDCKGERICEHGLCVEPSRAAGP